MQPTNARQGTDKLPVTFLTTEDGDKLLIEIGKLNKQADHLHSSVRDLSYYVHEELGPLLQRVSTALQYIDSNAVENRYLKSKKYKEQIIKEYTESLVVKR